MRKLYTSHENDIVNIDIGNIATPTLSQEESDSRERPITLHEAVSALKQMKNDESPGSDGYTVVSFLSFFFFFLSFFFFFFPPSLSVLGIFIIRSINYGFYCGPMSVPPHNLSRHATVYAFPAFPTLKTSVSPVFMVCPHDHHL